MEWNRVKKYYVYLPSLKKEKWEDECLDYPLIHPVPEGYQQHWDVVIKKYVLIRKHK